MPDLKPRLHQEYSFVLGSQRYRKICNLVHLILVIKAGHRDCGLVLIVQEV